MKKLIAILFFIQIILMSIITFAQDTVHNPPHYPPVPPLTDSAIYPPSTIIDSAFVGHLVDSVLTNVGAHPVNIFGWHTQWWIFICACLVVLEFILMRVKGAPTITGSLQKILKYINDLYNKK